MDDKRKEKVPLDERDPGIFYRAISRRNSRPGAFFLELLRGAHLPVHGGRGIVPDRHTPAAFCPEVL